MSVADWLVEFFCATLTTVLDKNVAIALAMDLYSQAKLKR